MAAAVSICARVEQQAARCADRSFKRITSSKGTKKKKLDIMDGYVIYLDLLT